MPSNELPMRKGTLPTQVMEKERERMSVQAQGSKCLLVMRWLGQRSLTFPRLKNLLILKGTPGNVKCELKAGILNSSP